MKGLKIKNVDTYFHLPNTQYLFVARNALSRAIIVSNKSGKYQLHAYDFETGFERRVTNFKAGMIFGSISADGEYIYYLKDTDGNENGHFVKVPFKGGREVNISPDIPDYFSYALVTDASASTLCFTASQKGKNSLFVSNSKKTRVIYSTELTLSEPIITNDGNYVSVSETNEKGEATLLLFNLMTQEVVRSTKKLITLTPLAFSSNSNRPLVIGYAKSGEWLRPFFYDFTTNKFSRIEHPSFKGDVWVLKWNEDQQIIYICEVFKAQQRLYQYDVKTKKLRRIGPKHGSFNYHFNCIAENQNGSLFIKWHEINTSSQVIELKPTKFSEWKDIKIWSGRFSSKYHVESKFFNSVGGQKVHMWVVRKSKKTGVIPFVIDLHGGPHGVVGDEFTPEIQAWVENGFGYCAVNYRGSISFGNDFEKKIYGDPGYYEVEDVRRASEILIKTRLSAPEKLILHGWSWGGFVALLAAGKYSKIWSAIIAGSAIADCVMQYEDEPAYFKALDVERFHGTPESNRSAYKKSSPIEYIETINAPVLLIHGYNDVRCPPRQIRAFVAEGQKHGKSMTVKWFDFGHVGSFTDTKLRIKLTVEAISFAKKAL